MPCSSVNWHLLDCLFELLCHFVVFCSEIICCHRARLRSVLFIICARSPYLQQNTEPLPFTPPAVPRNETRIAAQAPGPPTALSANFPLRTDAKLEASRVLLGGNQVDDLQPAPVIPVRDQLAFHADRA